MRDVKREVRIGDYSHIFVGQEEYLEDKAYFDEISKTHKAATWLLHPNAPKVEIPKIITDRIAAMKKMGGANDGE